MSTADRIERERLAKRARILDAARELFVERGVEAVTLREIAQRIEYSTTAIYVQFKDKQDLVEQMVREDFAAFVEALGAVATIVDPLERLGKLGDAYVGFALTMPRHYQLLFMTPAAGPPAPPELCQDPAEAPAGHAPPGVEGYHLLRHTVIECIEASLLRPELTDPEVLAQGIWACVHGLVSLLIVMGKVPEFQWRSPAELVRVTLGSLVDGMLATPRGLATHALVGAALPTAPAIKAHAPSKARRKPR